MSEETVKRNPARSCPKCQSNHVARKMTFRTVLVLTALLILDVVLLGSTPYVSATHHNPWILPLALGAMALMLMVLGALLVAIFGKNVCRNCGHKWR